MRRLMLFKRLKYIIMQLRVSNDNRVKTWNPKEKNKENRTAKQTEQRQPGVVIGSQIFHLSDWLGLGKKEATAAGEFIRISSRGIQD